MSIFKIQSYFFDYFNTSLDDILALKNVIYCNIYNKVDMATWIDNLQEKTIKFKNNIDNYETEGKLYTINTIKAHHLLWRYFDEDIVIPVYVNLIYKNKGYDEGRKFLKHYKDLINEYKRKIRAKEKLTIYLSKQPDRPTNGNLEIETAEKDILDTFLSLKKVAYVFYDIIYNYYKDNNQNDYLKDLINEFTTLLDFLEREATSENQLCDKINSFQEVNVFLCKKLCLDLFKGENNLFIINLKKYIAEKKEEEAINLLDNFYTCLEKTKNILSPEEESYFDIYLDFFKTEEIKNFEDIIFYNFKNDEKTSTLWLNNFKLIIEELQGSIHNGDENKKIENAKKFNEYRATFYKIILDDSYKFIYEFSQKYNVLLQLPNDLRVKKCNALQYLKFKEINKICTVTIYNIAANELGIPLLEYNNGQVMQDKISSTSDNTKKNDDYNAYNNIRKEINENLSAEDDEETEPEGDDEETRPEPEEDEEERRPEGDDEERGPEGDDEETRPEPEVNDKEYCNELLIYLHEPIESPRLFSFRRKQGSTLSKKIISWLEELKKKMSQTPEQIDVDGKRDEDNNVAPEEEYEANLDLAAYWAYWEIIEKIMGEISKNQYECFLLQDAYRLFNETRKHLVSADDASAIIACLTHNKSWRNEMTDKRVFSNKKIWSEWEFKEVTEKTRKINLSNHRNSVTTTISNNHKNALLTLLMINIIIQKRALKEYDYYLDDSHNLINIINRIILECNTDKTNLFFSDAQKIINDLLDKKDKMDIDICKDIIKISTFKENQKIINDIIDKEKASDDDKVRKVSLWRILLKDEKMSNIMEYLINSHECGVLFNKRQLHRKSPIIYDSDKTSTIKKITRLPKPRKEEPFYQFYHEYFIQEEILKSIADDCFVCQDMLDVYNLPDQPGLSDIPRLSKSAYDALQLNLINK